MTEETKQGIVRDLKHLYKKVFKNCYNKYYYSSLIRVDLNSTCIAFCNYPVVNKITRASYFYSLDDCFYYPFLDKELSKITKKRVFFKIDD